MATAQSSPPQEIEHMPLIRGQIWRRMNVLNDNWMGCITGETGSGKSWAGLRLCELLDPNFTVEKVAFSTKQFMELVKEDHPPGSMILMDESGVSMNSKTWWDSDQIQIGNILDTWRHQRRGAVFTLPSFGGMQKGARGRMSALLQAKEIDREEEKNILNYRYIQQDTDSGDLYKKYHRLRDPADGRVKKFKYIKLGKPSRELREAYEQKKQEFTAELNEEVLAEMSADEDAKQALGPKEVVQEIIEQDSSQEYISQHSGNKTKYVDQDLLRADYDLSHSDAKQAKKLLERERVATDD